MANDIKTVVSSKGAFGEQNVSKEQLVEAIAGALNQYGSTNETGANTTEQPLLLSPVRTVQVENGISIAEMPDGSVRWRGIQGFEPDKKNGSDQGPQGGTQP